MFLKNSLCLSLLSLASLVMSIHVPPTEFSTRSSCTVQSGGDASIDDVPVIESALKTCGNGGTIILSAGREYMIRSTLSFAGCTNCDFQVEGTMKMSNDTSFWEGKQATILLSGISGAKIHSVTGSGVIDGNGVPYWIAFAGDSSYRRPTLMYITASKSIIVSNLSFKNAANVFHSVTGGSSSVLYTSLTLSAVAADGATPKNTDGFDVGSSTYVTISNTKVTNQDDCVAFKPGASYTTVTNISCSGSHGLSVGSLGGGAGSTDTVQNIYVNGATMINSAKAVGIKLYEGGSSHGVATVRNVTYSNIVVQNSDYAAQIQSCYDSPCTTECTANPSRSSIMDVHFQNVSGTTHVYYFSLDAVACDRLIEDSLI